MTPRDSYISSGGEFWGGDPTGFHGFLDTGTEFEFKGRPERLRFRFNTDTAKLELDDIPVGEQLEWSVVAKAQYPYARLLPDYYRRGARQSGREFWAGYGLGRLALHYAPGDAHFVDASASIRRWFFRRNEGTSDALRLPADTWAAESRISYTYWNVRPDPSHRQRVHPFTRIRGIAGGLALSLQARLNTKNWGALADDFEPRDPRNKPANPIVTAVQWGAVGLPRDTPWYVRIEQRIRWGRNEDDLTRDRLGGLNPWVTSIAGLPWGAHVSGRYAIGRAGLRWTGWRDHELGAFGDWGLTADPRRVGRFESTGRVRGVGALAEFRFGNWRLDVRGGLALPTDWLVHRPTGAVWFSVGRQW